MSRKNARVEDDDPLDHEIDFSNPLPNPFARDYGRNRNLRILSPRSSDRLSRFRFDERGATHTHPIEGNHSYESRLILENEETDQWPKSRLMNTVL
jgi:hypothetical protein